MYHYALLHVQWNLAILATLGLTEEAGLVRWLEVNQGMFLM